MEGAFPEFLVGDVLGWGVVESCSVGEVEFLVLGSWFVVLGCGGVELWCREEMEDWISQYR